MIGFHDILWITEVWDYRRLRKAVGLARRAKLVYNMPVVYDAMDSLYKHYDRAKLAGEILKEKELESIKILEQEMYKLADIVIVVSEEEKNYIVENFDISPEKIVIVRNIHDPAEYSHNYGKTVCFVGGLMNFNNLLAIKFFLNNIYHHVLKKDSDIEFYVIGDRTEMLKLEELVEDKSLLELYRNKVHFIGWIEDVGKELKRHALTVAPMVSGSGIKGKILNSLEYGVPVVTTPLGAEGLPEITKSGIVIAEGPEEFAKKVVEIVKNDELRWSLSRKATAYVKEWFSKDRARETLERILPMIQKAIRVNFALARPYRYKLVDDYNLILPENYTRVDDLMEVIGMTLDQHRYEYPDIIRFSYLDIYNTEPWLKPDAINEGSWFSICACMPALVRKGVELTMLEGGRLTYVYSDLPICYMEHSARDVRNKIIEFGLKYKMLFKKHPLVEKMAKKIYEYLRKQ
ncbi:glycosyltransferase [Hydrogenobacter sp. Uz 6-8]|uniref:glycosyltransferase n=1 Tax=Hydrogenobacter sp. Uz 6-8 TaxID=3384828 RepID=UPI0038FD21B3